MTGYNAIVGHEDTKEYLKAAVVTGKVNHAYLVEGPTGSGKMLLAEAFAAALTCEEGGAEACGVCRSCHQALDKCHPDIRYLLPEKPGLISVDDIRSQVVDDIQTRPYYGRRKIYIIEYAEQMNAQAQNALLKTLEEPPEYAVLILLTTNAGAMLETIRSRCTLLPLHPLNDPQIQLYLMEHRKLPEYKAKLCTAFAQGSLGRAMKLADSEDFMKIRSVALDLAAKAREMDMPQILNVVKEVSGFELTVQDFLDILSIWYRDVLYFKATQAPDRLIFQDELQQIRKTAATSSYEGLETILRALDKSRERLRANVDFDLTMQLLFMVIKEN